MLDVSRSLSASALDAVRDLERRVLEADGGRLKLEWGMLSGELGGRVEGLMWWEDESLQGFLGIYSFGSAAELTGMVDPSSRRRGIARALLDAAQERCRDQRFDQVLLIVPRASRAGRSLAVQRGAMLEHSEHAMALVGDPADAPTVPELRLRPAGPPDLGEVARLLEAAFGSPVTDLGDRPSHPGEQTLLAEFDGRAIATVRLTRHGDEAGVYGLAVDPAWQRRGIGRDVLRRSCQLLRADGAERIGLEVAVDNDRALELYVATGFAAATTEDYYALPLR